MYRRKRSQVALTLSVLAILLLAAAAHAQRHDWESPAVFRINKEPAHCTLVPYPMIESAAAGFRMARFVPEPATSALLAVGALTMALAQRRRRH